MTLPPKKPDPSLVKYLRQHMKKFGSDALRENLIAEGVPEEDITAALTETTLRPAAARRMMPVLVIAGVGIATLVLFAVLSSNPSRTPAPATNPPDAAADPTHPFLGHSGYVLQLPQGYAALTDFKNDQKTLETVYLFPKGTDPTNFGNEGIYAQLGILRLEASPRRIPEGRIGMEAIRSGVTRTLQARKATFTSREVQAGGMPALVVSITEPFQLTQSFVLGTKTMYVLTGGAEEGTFSSVLESLREVSQ